MSGYQENHLTSILETHITDAYATLDDFVATECLLADISQCLLRALTVLSEIAHSMAYGEHIDLYLSRKVREMEDFDGFDNLQPLDRLSQKEKFLKSVCFSFFHLAA